MKWQLCTFSFATKHKNVCELHFLGQGDDENKVGSNQHLCSLFTAKKITHILLTKDLWQNILQ